jgi:polygalacturonase
MSRRSLLAAAFALVFGGIFAYGQSSSGIALPDTMTTIAGGLVATPANGALCPGSSTVKAITANGAGCAAVAASFGASGRGGAVVDAYGNVFVADDINLVAYMIDQTTGIISVLAGGGTACSAKADSLGDGCLAATQTVLKSARGIGTDPYGNVLLAGYNDNAIHIVCRAPSPVCTAGAATPTAANPVQVQIGNMGLVAGCMGSATGVGTQGTGADNTPAYSTSLSSALAGFKNTGSCTASLGETSNPRGAAADIYGNVYYADTSTSRTRVVLGPLTSNYFQGNNPLYTALKTHWAAPKTGYVYTLVNLAGTGTGTGGTATVTGASCSDSNSGTTYTGAATDIRGDGCPYSVSAVDANSGYTNGVAVDAAGNMVFTDPGNGSSIYGGLRVFFVQGWSSASAASAAGATGSIASAGVAMYNAIVANNSGVTPQSGFIYSLAGGSGMQSSPTGTALTTSPILGNNAKINDSSITRVTVSPQGHIFIGDNSKVLFYDMVNGTIRILLAAAGSNPAFGGHCSGSSGQIARSAYGDGCSASASSPGAVFGNGNGLNVSVDGQGNLYLYDTLGTSGMLVRKVLAQGTGVEPAATLAALSTVTTAAPLQALGVSQPQTLRAHFFSATGSAATVSTSGASSFTFGTPSCTFYSAVDNSADCSLTATFTPNGAGVQTASATITASGGESVTFNLAGTAVGSVLAVDGAASAGTPMLKTAALLSGYSPSAMAIDAAGNVYEASGTSIVESVGGSPASSQVVASGLAAAPTQLAIDATGNIFYLNGSSSIQELAVTTAGTSATYNPTTISYTPGNLGTPNPVAIALDEAGNLLVADEQSSAGTIYRLSVSALNANTQGNCSYPASQGAVPSLCETQVYNAGAFGAISALAADAAGNIYVADTTAGAIRKLAPGVDENSGDSTYKQYVYTLTTAASTIAGALAVDAAGDLYVQSASTSAGVVEYPVSGPTLSGVAVYGAVTYPAGLAVDALGNLYSADGAVSSVTQVQRGATVENFVSSTTTQFTATLTNTGNQTSTTQTATPTTGAEASDFTLAGGSSYGCTFTSSLLNAMTAGQACTVSAYFPALGNTTETDFIAFAPTAPAVATVGMLTLTGIGDTEAFSTTATIGAPSPASPVYTPSGTEVSFPITVTASSTSIDGLVTNNTNGPTTSDYVTVSVDSQPAANYNFTSTNGLSASLTLSLSGLTATSHSFVVTFPQQGELISSSANSGAFPIAPLGTSVVWTPGTNTQQVSAPLGAGVLNAGISPATNGSVVYSITAAPNCGSTSMPTVDASTYLPIGSYTIYATFCPSDSTDYVSSSSSISYTVTQATTTAAVGASTMVVAPSGANFTSLTAALQALPAAGGAIYVSPGTYSGQNAISYPNVQLRGLGGDPTQVVLTGENGAFSASTLPPGFTLGPAGKGGDEGSATLDVSKNGYMGTQAVSGSYTPNNFYAEYLTVQNTYNTDSTTTTTTTGSACTPGSTAATLQSLYNNGQECGPQALALDLSSDQAVLNHVNLVSQQDTLYAATLGCGTYCTVARNYFWNGTIVGDTDYVFGDAALVFDHTNFFTTWHGLTATGEETIEAQNKRYPTGTTRTTNSSYPTSTDYLSGFICNNCTLMSQSTGMTKLYYGRPYDISTSNYPSSYSTWIMLNSAVDQVNPSGWIGWDGGTEYLSTSTYGEYNTQAYTDPAVGTKPYPFSVFNSTPSILYTADSGNATSSSLLPTGNNTGSYGVLPTSSTPANRESSALDLTAAQAVQYFPINFLSTPVPTTKLATGQSATWNPVSTLASLANSFVPTSRLNAIGYGTSVTILGRPQTPGAGIVPTGTYAFYDSQGTNQVCTAPSSTCVTLASGNLDASGEAYLTTSSLTAGAHFITMVYGGDANFTGSTSSTYSISVLTSSQLATSTALTVNNTSSTSNTAVTGSIALSPASATGTVSILLDGVSAATCALTNGACTWSIAGIPVGPHTLWASYAGNAAFGESTSANVSIQVVAPVATGDSRAITEPSFPAVCSQLTAALTTDPAIQDLDASVDAANTNIDGARIQQALNNCAAAALTANANLAVELSVDSTGTYNAFLSGPLSMPSNVTLLVDPAVTLYFSRNVQDYDMVPGTHTCGTINGASNTASCQPLIAIPGTSSNVGIMGYGKLNGRGGDALINAFATAGYTAPSSYTWWNLAAQANGEGSQQNPRFIQMNTGASNLTLYKITILNAPNFHVSTTGGVTGFTAWDVKIVTPTSARNTDGIDPANVVNGTITRSWISDGDDNVAVSGPGTTAPAANISVTNNRFFAGHGESIGSYTGAGVSNILFDSNVSVGNAWAGFGSAALTPSDTNSTAVRIKTANDRGGLVTNIQYSNSCFYDHKADIQLTPYYSAGDSTSAFPSYTNILMQNLIFASDTTSIGTVELTGEFNSNGGSPVTNPLGITMDNVTFPGTLASLVNSTAPVESTAVWGTGNYSGGTGEYVNLSVGPGQVSSNFLTAYGLLVANPVNQDVLMNNITLSSPDPPACTITYLAPELTGPKGVPQTISSGQSATLDVILTPAVGGAPYPSGTVQLSDALTGNTFNATFPGTGDTLAVTIPASDLTIGTHTFSVTSYSGDANYTVPAALQTFGAYTVNVAPLNVTSSVSITSSGLGYNRITKTGTATITAKNTSSATINGPLQLLMTISNPAVTPANATGTYQGSPYWTNTGSLAPGASVSFVVSFTYALGTTFTTVSSLYSGGI